MKRAQQLHQLMAAGQIVEIVEQPKIHLGVPENSYRPDFLVIEPGGLAYYEDVKGVETQTFKKTKRLWRSYGRLPLHVVKEKSGRFSVIEVIEPDTGA